MESMKSTLHVAYRAFVINDVGRLSGVPEIITAADDGEAVVQAELLLGPQPIEVWEGARLVARIPLPTGRAGSGHVGFAG